MINTEEDMYLQLTEEDIFKIDFIRSTIEQEVSRPKVVGGMLDEGFGIAICIQHREGELTPEGLQHALGLLDDELKSVVLEKISKDSPSN